MLATVLRNLVSNAIKFTLPGGTITVAARREGDEVEISVTDTGVGMPPGRVDDLFRLDRRTTTNGTAGERGSGLGLLLCRDLVERQGGVLEVRSAIDRGNDLPVQAARIPHRAARIDRHGILTVRSGMASQASFMISPPVQGCPVADAVVVAMPIKVKWRAGEPGEIEFLEIRPTTVSAPARHRARARRREVGVATATPESRAVKGFRMAAKHSRHIALTEPLIAYVEAQVAKGEYTCISEVVRTALRLLIERDEAKAFRGAANSEVARDRA